MLNKELSVETDAQSSTEAYNSTSASVEANPLLSAVLSVEEDNKLIAGFMGKKIQNDWVILGGKYNSQYHISVLKYQSDWNDLMSVVEKINKTLEPLTVSLQVTTAGVFLTKIHNAICEVDIKLAHSEIVSAIKWYNDNAVSVGSR